MLASHVCRNLTPEAIIDTIDNSYLKRGYFILLRTRSMWLVYIQCPSGVYIIIENSMLLAQCRTVSAAYWVRLDT